jgi:Uma2 family endonuclease
MEHEETNRSIATLVELVAEEWEIDLMNLGSTTFEREDLKLGFEPDTCFYFQNAERIRGKDEIDLHIDLPPDLVIEIDITSRSVDKLSIYAAFGVSEVWRYSGKLFMIFKLDAGRYIQINESLALPGLTGAIIVGFIEDSQTLKRLDWMKRIREWAHDHRPS